MHIATPADKLTDLRVGSTVRVNSFGHDYHARVAELKGKRARCVWTNKSGVKYDRWITLPGQQQHELNPVAAATRKLRAEATRRERYAKEWMTSSRDRHAARIEQLRDYQAEAEAGRLTYSSKDTQYGTVVYHIGEDTVWGGYTAEAAKQYRRPADEAVDLTFAQALQRALDHEIEQLDARNADIRAAHEAAKELRAKADSIQKGAK
jgi:hypothetical protein